MGILTFRKCPPIPCQLIAFRRPNAHCLPILIARLKDRFILVQSGIRDKRDEFDQALKDKIEFCDSQEREYNGLIIDLTAKIAHWNTVLAKCTADQNQAETTSHQ